MLDNIFLNVADRFEGWEGKIGVLDRTPWPKPQIMFLLQGDGRHHHDDQVGMTFEALTGVSCMEGRPS